jgi:hypothetical protein
VLSPIQIPEDSREKSIKQSVLEEEEEEEEEQKKRTKERKGTDSVNLFSLHTIHT